MEPLFSNIKCNKLILNCNLLNERPTLLKIISITNKNKYYNE